MTVQPNDPIPSLKRFESQREQYRKDSNCWMQRYSDLENLLFRGFLTNCLLIDDTRFVFKTLNSTEFERISIQVGSKNLEKPIYQTYFIAYSILFIDDSNVLPIRDNGIGMVRNMLLKAPFHVLNSVAENLAYLNNRSIEAGKHIEAYSYEDMSRQNWISYRNVSLNSPVVTGIDGTQSIGLNSYQKLWATLNYIEDFKQEQEAAWEHAKFIGSCFNPKGVKSIDAQDKARKQREKEERELIRGGGIRQDNKIHVEANSVEDMMQQLERSLRGEKDWHDKVVEEHERKLKEAFEARRAELLKVTNKPRLPEVDSDPTEKLRVFSFDEAQRSVAERRRKARESVNVYQEVAALTNQNKVIQKRYNTSLINNDIVEKIEEVTPDISTPKK